MVRAAAIASSAALAGTTPPPEAARERRWNASSHRRERSRGPCHEPDATRAPAVDGADDDLRPHGRVRTHRQSPDETVRRALVAQPTMPSPASPQHISRELCAASSGVPADGIPRALSRSLLEDPSMYTNPHLTRDRESTTLEELAHLVRLSKYQERKRVGTRIRLHRTLVATALSARLSRCGDVAHRNLVDNFRRDDKDGFARLYDAIHDVRRSCDELRRYAMLEPEMASSSSSSSSSPSVAYSDGLDPSPGSALGVESSRDISPFLHDLSASARDVFFDFLCQLRTNPDYLATRIGALTSSELNAFLTFHKGLEPVESVLPFHGRSANRPHSHPSGRAGGHNADIERLLSFQRHDPLSILVHACFANSAGPDSSEDQRRTDIWSTVLAGLIQRPKSGSEHFIISVLNIWTTMRDWSGKSNMEWYLMKILDDGAFLLDRAEDQHGTRFNLSDWNRSDDVAADAFYEKAVGDLFGMVDDDDDSGIPDGLLELGNAIVEKLDGLYVENTSKWFVWRCLFFVFLLGVIVNPESYSMLSDYHITPYAREKILKKVAMKAHEYVSSMWSGKPSATCVPVDVPPKIKGHVERILARFKGSRAKPPAAKLLPARSVTSLRETMEVHPYLLISPADLVTLVNALFPEPRPLSAASSLPSGPASISALSSISQPVAVANDRSGMETASIISTSVSSTLSDGPASRETSSDGPDAATPQPYSPPPADAESQRRLSRFEDDGYRLRLALHELARNLGPDVLRGACHPCAERWAVLFIAADGRGLSTHMTYDPDDERDEENNSSSSDTDDEAVDDGPELDKDYHQLRDSILRLVEDYEIPRNLEPHGERAQLSNRASRLKKYKTKNKMVTLEMTVSSRNPYRRHSVKGPPNSPPGNTVQAPDPVLVAMLKAASAQSRAQADFVSAHAYWKTWKHLDALESQSLRENGFAELVNIFSRSPRDSIRRSASAIEEYDAWLVWLKQSQERHEGSLDRMMRRIRAMRDKMWFVTDVRNSKEYVHSRDVCQALKTMALPRRRSSFQRSRPNAARVSGASYLHRAESQVMDLLAASEEQGGPNKLSDDQAEKTSLWLRRSGIANFCQGEERIHRFCCEVDMCMSKLVGETIREAPVLWSSELFKREKLAYDRMRAREREHASSATDDAASVLSDGDRRFTPSSSRAGSFTRDRRSVGALQSIEARYTQSRASATLGDALDNQELREKVSPVHTLDSVGTFWSPFQPTMSPRPSASRACSPSTSLTNLSVTTSGPFHHIHLPWSSSPSAGRPGTSASSNETAFPLRAEDDRTRFLAELKQTLTSLLLSDLGSLVLARGSETDVWFQGIGQQCIERKEAMGVRTRRGTETEAKNKNGGGTTRPRVVEKKRSCNNLRGAGEDGPGKSDNVPDADANTTLPGDADGHGKKMAIDKGDGFPFKGAFRRLLNMFSVHPNPYTKLRALNELERLIIASLLANGSTKLRGNRSDAGSSIVEDQGGGRPTQLEGIIDSVKERRSQALQSASGATGFVHQSRRPSSETRSIMSGNASNTDAVTRELQALFRDASMRPKSLFRDLQLISAFVPPAMLDRLEKGKAFWNTGLAALKVKAEVCRTMVEMADGIIAAHTQSRTSAPKAAAPASSASSTGTPPPSSTTYTLTDVGRMWAITAKEGYPAAQRELALFYLSNPEFVEQTTLPLSKPREVFKQTVMEKYGKSERGRGSMSGPGGSSDVVGGAARVSGALGGSGSGDGASLGSKEGDVRNDVGLMCVAVHWMEAAEQGGDELATSFLRQNEFMSRA
ncbi:hypothetical protein RJ55_08244 [Drechmeria coniospora]|nr:hypothetical protein RJ55_08244 [Drechmeria coniospora]